MESIALCTCLLKAEHEDEVDRILTSCGYGLDNESAWQPLAPIQA
jgi:hypothetical protein